MVTEEVRGDPVQPRSMGLLWIEAVPEPKRYAERLSGQVLRGGVAYSTRDICVQRRDFCAEEPFEGFLHTPTFPQAGG
jgi:hypothetical protein